MSDCEFLGFSKDRNAVTVIFTNRLQMLKAILNLTGKFLYVTTRIGIPFVFNGRKGAVLEETVDE